MSTPRTLSPRRLLLATAAMLLVVAAACQPADTTTGQTGAAPSGASVWA